MESFTGVAPPTASAAAARERSGSASPMSPRTFALSAQKPRAPTSLLARRRRETNIAVAVPLTLKAQATVATAWPTDRSVSTNPAPVKSRNDTAVMMERRSSIKEQADSSAAEPEPVADPVTERAVSLQPTEMEPLAAVEA